MATACAVLHHKQPHFFWTGFYRLQDSELVVGPYEGPLACSELAGPQGVCWAAVTNGASVVVADVHAFPGHVACDSRSQSEIVVPVRDAHGNIVAVLDVDSDRPAAFSDVDREGLAIVALIHAPRSRATELPGAAHRRSSPPIGALQRRRSPPDQPSDARTSPHTAASPIW